MGMVTASFGWPPPPVFFSSSLLFSEGVDCEWSAPGACPAAAADDDEGLRGCTASGVWAGPGGGRLGGGIEVSMEGFASPGDGDGMVEAAGEPSMGANLAVEAVASPLRAESLLRDDIVRARRARCRGCLFGGGCGGGARNGRHARDETVVPGVSIWDPICLQLMSLGVVGCGCGRRAWSSTVLVGNGAEQGNFANATSHA